MKMNYPSTEQRRPRDVFTKKLVKICELLDAKHKDTIVARLVSSLPPKAHAVEIRAVWVFGSYARGAATCGDLDLLVDAHPYVPVAAINKAFLGSLPDVRPMLGSIENHGTTIDFSHAVKVWEPGMNWREALSSMLPSATGDRFARPTDGLPFRFEQLPLDYEEAEPLVQQIADGVYTSQFIPLDALSPMEVGNPLKKVIGRTGPRAKMAPYIQAYLSSLPDVDPEHPVASENGYLIAGQTLIAANSTRLSLSALDEPSTRRIVIMPALSLRGPNGVWVLERGPAHPLLKLFEGKKAWAECDELGKPKGVLYLGDRWPGKAIGLYASQDICREELAQLGCNPDMVCCLEGDDILTAMMGMDFVDLVSQSNTSSSLPLTPVGNRLMFELEGDFKFHIDWPKEIQTFLA